MGTEPVMAATLQKSSKFETIVVTVLGVLAFIAFGYVAVMSFLQTSVFERTNIALEVVQYQPDNILLNLFFTVLFFALLFWLRRYYDFFAKVDLRVMEIVLV